MLKGLSPLEMALLGTGFTFLMTAVGAATVFFVKDRVNPKTQHAFLGFAAGVMIEMCIRDRNRSQSNLALRRLLF